MGNIMTVEDINEIFKYKIEKLEKMIINANAELSELVSEKNKQIKSILEKI